MTPFGRLVKICKEPSYAFPTFYGVIVIIGLLLFSLSSLIPSFRPTACITLGGQEVCTLIGIYLATIVSLPGYIVLGGVFRTFGLNLPVFVSYSILLITNIVLYYLFGRVVNKLNKLRADPDRFITAVVVCMLVLVTFIYLLLKTV